MEVRVNTDNHINNSKDFSSRLTEEVRTRLSKFSTHITTVEVFLSDANSHKGGSDDKSCVIEARLEGREPSAVTQSDATLQEAFRGALRKTERMIRKDLEKVRGR